MSDAEAQVKASRFANLTRTLSELLGTDGTDSDDFLSFWVPGRIEVLGKHTDYGGGRSLLCAVERGICVVAKARQIDAVATDSGPSSPHDPSPSPHDPSPSPHPSPSSPRKRGSMLSILRHDFTLGVARQQMDSRFRGNDDIHRQQLNSLFRENKKEIGPRCTDDDDAQHTLDETSETLAQNIVRVIDANSGETCQLALAADTPAQPGQWCNYPITVARRVAMNFSGPMRGADIIFSSDLPHAAGVSSSSALVVAMFLALSTVNDLPQRPEYRENILSAEDLGGYLGCVENGLDFKS
ncbi:MAG: galactokinase family protein, partial [Gemmatimonadaceae bacterium]